MLILNNLLGHGAEAKHPEGFRLLIDAYFTGVKCLADKPALAEGYFSLVKKYGEILNPIKPAQPEPVQEQVGPVVQEEDSAGDPEENEPGTAPEEQAESIGIADPEGAIVVGGESSYRVVQHDTVSRVAAKFSMSPRFLLRVNRLAPTAKLHKGQLLRIVDRHIVPKRLINGLLINVADCTLYLFKNGTVASALPVVVGRAKSEERSWQTPLGSFKVTAKVKYPTWHIPQSIQKEMEDRGEEVRSEIPPGPDNPLGKFAIRTTLPGILIHGTNAPSLKSGPLSHGCIRVAQNKIESLFNEVRVNTSGEIIYRPVKIAVHSDGRVYLEVNQDIYRKFGDLTEEVRDTIAKLKLDPAIDWDKVGRVVREESGFAEEISL